jgi:hypothetical protein
MKCVLVVTAALAVAGLLLISESASARMAVVGGGFRGVGFRGGFVGARIGPGFGVEPRLGY